MPVLLINFLSVFVYYLFPHSSLIVVFIVSALVMIIFPRLRAIGVLIVMCAAVYGIAHYDLTTNSQFIENKLFDAKFRISEEYEALQRTMHDDWAEFVAQNYSITHDRGYRVVNSQNDIVTWSGSEDFLPDAFYALHSKSPSLSVYNNDISMRYTVEKNGTIYYLRHFLSNMYRSQDMKSVWLKKFEHKNSVQITFYVSQGQMYINREVIDFNDIKKGEHVFIADKNTLYTKIDESLLIKLQSMGIGDYTFMLRKMFFFLTALLVTIVSFLSFAGKQRLLLHIVIGALCTAAVTLPLMIIAIIALILVIDRMIIMDSILSELHLFTYENLAAAVMIFLPLLALLLQIMSNPMLLGSFMFGVFTQQFFMYLFSAYAGFLVVLFLLPHIPRQGQEGSALVMFIAGLWISPVMIAYIVAVIALLFFTRKKYSTGTHIYITVVAVMVFIAFYPILMMSLQKNTSKTVLYFVERSEREVQQAIDITADILRNDEQIQWTLAERIHYDDNNFAFYKWSNTPLAQKQYPHFLYFENSEKEIISSFSYKCSLVNYPQHISSASVIDSGNFWMHRMQVFHSKKPIGNIVIGIAKDFWRYTADIPIVFSRTSSGITTFSTGRGERPSSHFSEITLFDDGDTISVWRKKPLYVIFRSFIALCGMILVLFVIKLVFSNKITITFDFRSRMLLSMLILLLLPFVFSTLLIFNNYSSSLSHYIGREVEQTRSEILSNTRQWYSRFYTGKYFSLPAALPDVPWGLEWTLYAGPQRIMSHNEDLYRLNLSREYLPRTLMRQLEQKKEAYSYFWGKGIVDVYYLDPQTEGLTVKLRIALDKMQREDFFDTVILFMGINIVLIALLLQIMTLFIKKIINPVSDLLTATHEVSMGNFSYKIDKTTDITEMNILLSNFNAMTAKLAAYKNNLTETQSFLREIIGSLPVAAVVYDKKRGIVLYNDDMEQLAPAIALHKDPLEVIEIPVDFYAANVSEVRFKGHILRITVRQFKYGYICTVSDITSFVIAEKTQVWFDLAQEIAHELKNPLMPLEFSVNRLEKAVNTLSLQEKDRVLFKELLDVMREETTAIATLVKDFRDMTQKSEADVNPLDITAEISAVANGFKPYPIQFSFSDTLPLVYFPANKLKMILKNILKNAIEAIPDTKPIEIRVYSATLPTEWGIAVRSNTETFVIVHIRDYAGGIRQEIRDQLFEPYYSSKKGGSGLGLYIVKKIMNEYGNEVYVQVRDGDGTDIYLLFTTEVTE